MSGVDELVAFLRAALDEDEQVALAATDGPWRYDPTKHHREPGTVRFSEGVFAGPPGRDANCVAITGETDDPQSMADAEHIARWDPARVLAEVEAKRERLDWIESELGDDPADESAQWLAKLEARPYAGQPGWREEWQLSDGA